MSDYIDPLEGLLGPAVLNAFRSCFHAEVDPARISFQNTRPEFPGDITINVFPFLKQSGTGPEPTALAIGEQLKEKVEEVVDFNVVKGFLNLSLSTSYWTDFVRAPAADDLLRFKSSGRLVMVEYSSPNTNKPLHLGHLRNNFLGHSVSRLLEAAGHEVIKAQVINDRGIHICKSMLAWQRFGNGETPQSTGLKGDKLVGKYYVRFDQELKKEIKDLVDSGTAAEEAEKTAPLLLEAQNMLRKWESDDPETVALWKKMNGWVYDGFDVTYTAMGVDFDKLYYESETFKLGRERVMEGLERGIFFKKDDGSVWCDLTEDGLDEKLVLRSDGTAVYMTQDIGTAIERFKDYPDLKQLIYTVGNEQDYHFKVLFLILKKLGYSWADELHHLSYGMVDLPEGKMKSREGTVVDADDLIADMIATAKQNAEELGKTDEMSEAEAQALNRMVGLAALKYFLLKVDPQKRILFDPKASIDLNGHTGPFIQYTHARIRSLLRKADWQGGETTSPEDLLDPELSVIKLLHQFPAVLAHGADNLDPSGIANHAYELVKAYNSFYQGAPPILKETDTAVRDFRLLLSERVADATKQAMWILGIEVPERM
jgi:arginyl-tRNA synthetase